MTGLPELELPGPHRGLVDRLEEVAAVLGDAVALEFADASLTSATCWTVGRVARRALRAIEQAAPEGPLALVGHSLGGLVALRVAQLLGARGRSVSLLTLLDTYLPPAAKPDDAPRTMGPAGAPAAQRDLWGDPPPDPRGGPPPVRPRRPHRGLPPAGRPSGPLPPAGALGRVGAGLPLGREHRRPDVVVSAAHPGHRRPPDRHRPPRPALRVPHLIEVASAVRAVLDAREGG